MVHAGREIAKRQAERAEQSADEYHRTARESLAQRTGQRRQGQAQRGQNGRYPRGDGRRAVGKRFEDLDEQHAVRLDQSGHPKLHEERAQHNEPAVAAVQRFGRSHAAVLAAVQEAFGKSARNMVAVMMDDNTQQRLQRRSNNNNNNTLDLGDGVCEWVGVASAYQSVQ